MKYLKDYFSGKKTYILGVLTALYGVLTVFDVINFTAEQEKAVFVFLAAVFTITLRAGIAKSE